MKYYLHSKQLVLIFTFLSLIFACQEDPLVTEEIDLVDEDMNTAITLAREYLNSSHNGRLEGEPATIVVRFENGNLLFDTNTDTITDYQVVTKVSGTQRVPFWNPGVPPKSDFAKSLFLI